MERTFAGTAVTHHELLPDTRTPLTVQVAGGQSIAVRTQELGPVGAVLQRAERVAYISAISMSGAIGGKSSAPLQDKAG